MTRIKGSIHPWSGHHSQPVCEQFHDSDCSQADESHSLTGGVHHFTSVLRGLFNMDISQIDTSIRTHIYHRDGDRVQGLGGSPKMTCDTFYTGII